MKTSLNFLFSILLISLIASCSSNNDSSAKGNNQDSDYKTYREAIAANDFEAAHSIIAQAEGDHETMDRDDFEKEYGIKYHNGIDAAKEEIFDKEVKFLVANGSEEATARLVFLFSDFEIKGKRLAEGLNDYHDGYGNQYAYCVDKYNRKLDMVLDLAISQDNKELAKRILKLYKQNIDVFLGGSSHSVDQANGITRYYDIAPDGTEVDGNHCYVTYSNKDKEAAKKKYEENFGKLDDNADDD